MSASNGIGGGASIGRYAHSRRAASSGEPSASRGGDLKARANALAADLKDTSPASPFKKDLQDIIKKHEYTGDPTRDHGKSASMQRDIKAFIADIGDKVLGATLGGKDSGEKESLTDLTQKAKTSKAFASIYGQDQLIVQQENKEANKAMLDMGKA